MHGFAVHSWRLGTVDFAPDIFFIRSIGQMGQFFYINFRYDYRMWCYEQLWLIMLKIKKHVRNGVSKSYVSCSTNVAYSTFEDFLSIGTFPRIFQQKSIWLLLPDNELSRNQKLG